MQLKSNKDVFRPDALPLEDFSASLGLNAMPKLKGMTNTGKEEEEKERENGEEEEKKRKGKKKKRRRKIELRNSFFYLYVLIFFPIYFYLKLQKI